MKESVHSMEESVDSIKRVHWLLQESYDSLKEYSDSNKESFWLHIGVKTTLGVKTILRKGHNDPSSKSSEMTPWGQNDSFQFTVFYSR